MGVSYRLYVNGKFVDRYYEQNDVYELVGFFEMLAFKVLVYADLEDDVERKSWLLYDSNETYAWLKKYKIKVNKRSI